MEEELNDVSVTLKPEGKKRKHHLHLVTAVLGITFVILVSILVFLIIHTLLEQQRKSISLTTQNLLLCKEMMDLQKEAEELTREKESLNWTIGVILEYDSFPVHTHCPGEVCRTCLDGWIHFRSSCYKFNKFVYSHNWKTWQESRDYCRQMRADLVVIESLQEQEFINNHTKVYDSEKHGYWIGLSNWNEMSRWLWVDGSNVTMSYWTAGRGYTTSCTLSLPSEDPLANWNKASCFMKNRWICETKALIKPA